MLESALKLRALLVQCTAARQSEVTGSCAIKGHTLWLAGEGRGQQPCIDWRQGETINHIVNSFTDNKKENDN